MKQKVIYIVLLLIIVVLGVVVYQQYKEIQDLELVLSQCEDAYYKNIGY